MCTVDKIVRMCCVLLNLCPPIIVPQNFIIILYHTLFLRTFEHFIPGNWGSLLHDGQYQPFPWVNISSLTIHNEIIWSYNLHCHSKSLCINDVDCSNTMTVYNPLSYNSDWSWPRYNCICCCGVLVYNLPILFGTISYIKTFWVFPIFLKNTTTSIGL